MPPVMGDMQRWCPAAAGAAGGGGGGGGWRNCWNSLLSLSCHSTRPLTRCSARPALIRSTVQPISQSYSVSGRINTDTEMSSCLQHHQED